MSEVTILAACKSALRLTGSTIYDDEINNLLEAAETDLVESGVVGSVAQNNMDPLVRMAKIVYVKAHFGYNNPDAEALKEDYRARVCKMVLLDRYRGD